MRDYMYVAEIDRTVLVDLAFTYERMRFDLIFGFFVNLGCNGHEQAQ